MLTRTFSVIIKVDGQDYISKSKDISGIDDWEVALKFCQDMIDIFTGSIKAITNSQQQVINDGEITDLDDRL